MFLIRIQMSYLVSASKIIRIQTTRIVFDHRAASGTCNQMGIFLGQQSGALIFACTCSPARSLPGRSWPPGRFCFSLALHHLHILCPCMVVPNLNGFLLSMHTRVIHPDSFLIPKKNNERRFLNYFRTTLIAVVFPELQIILLWVMLTHLTFW
jgi:hypothetical protein